MKYHYCPRCKLPSKKLYNCKYEKHDKSWFLLCTVCVLECRKIYKKAFKKSVEEIKKFQKKHKDYFNKINIKRTSSRSINILDFNY